MRQPLLAAAILASGVAPPSLGCGHEQTPRPPPSVAAAPAPATSSAAPNPPPPPDLPPDISEKIRRIDPQRFELQRPLLALIAKPAAEWHREYMNGQVVFTYYGRKLKLSPEQVGDDWEGVRAYLDLDARIAHRQQAAQDVLTALDTRAEDHPGSTPLDKARHAIDEHLAKIKADQERKTAPRPDADDIRARLAAAKRALSVLQSLHTWQPPLDGTLPALLGFKDLDVIEEVNGRPVKSLGEIVDELSKLGERASQIEVEVERDGRPVLLTYRIVDQ